MHAPLQLTVAICTWNRCRILAHTLEGLTRVASPAGVHWDLLVVDNACTDDTVGVVARFADRLPLRRVVEPQPGLSHARNRAVAAATGDWILWTDDDVQVDPGWLEGYAQAIHRHPEAGFFGGPIKPLFVEPPPRWLTSNWHQLGGIYALRDLGPRSFQLGPDTRLPFGANYAVRADVQRRHRYDPQLGKQQSGGVLVGEETLVLKQLLADGVEGWWVPGARVRHLVPPDRQTHSYLRRWAIGWGRTRVRLGLGGKAAELSLIGLFLHLLRWETKMFLLRSLRPPEEWLQEQLEVTCWWGMLRERLARLRGPGSV